MELCIKGDKLLEEGGCEGLQVERRSQRGQCHPTTISPSAYITPYTPLADSG